MKVHTVRNTVQRKTQHVSKGICIKPQEMHLQLRQVRPLQKLHKARNDALADDLLDRRVSLCKQRQ